MNKLLVLLCFFSCHRSTPEPDPNREGYACGQVIAYKVKRSTAPIAYSERINRYYIGSDMTQTDVGIFCNLPDEYKVVGKVLTFDGGFAPVSQEAESELVKLFPNRGVYHLKITKIY